MSGTEYTFYFAWVPPETPWDPSLARFDEDIFDFQISHDEGQIPEAVIVIRNPRIGLISPTRLYWAWFSFSWGSCSPFPLMFGRLVGIPEEILGNTIRIKFIARDTDYIYQKQQVARSLKILPNYDKLCFDVSKRDDPDAILEGWSALYHVERIGGRVSASDILVGEDGTVTFAPEDTFYDSVKYRLLQSPLVAVNVKIDVEWEQRYRGSLFVGAWAWPTLGSDPFVGEWPKSGSNLGGGWYAGVSWAGERDPSIQEEALKTMKPQLPSINYIWTNKADGDHQFGDVMSIEVNYVPVWGKFIIINQTDVRGLVYQELLAPDAKNKPSNMFVDWFCYKTYDLNFLGKQSVATLDLVYAANRKRSERLEMTIKADVQPVLTDPLVTEDTEQIVIKSGDLSLPIVDLLNWDTVGRGELVTIGTLIFPDNPLVPGQTSSQIALNTGNTGMVQPTFSNISGATTIDGTVTWVSLGETPPAEVSQDWVRLAPVPLGALILPMPISGVPNIYAMEIPGQLNYPPTGTGVPLYSVLSKGEGGPGDTMYECIAAGMLGGLGPQAAFQTFINPSGKWMYMCIQAGKTGEFHPAASFPGGVGSQTVDGTVIWQCISAVSLPIGGSPGMTPAATYFPTDRGLQTMLHGYCRARAKIRKRARAAEISFDTRFEVAALCSCRMNGHVTDPVRIPGGQASGKIISYKLMANGDSGVVKGTITLGCSIGKTPVTLEIDTGTPSYVNEGYVNPGYQTYYSSVSGAQSGTRVQQGVAASVIPLPPDWPSTPPTIPSCLPLHSTWSPGSISSADEFGYTPPTPAPNDDGLVFPLTLKDATLRMAWHGIASTMNPLNIQLYQLQLDQVVHDAVSKAKKVVIQNSPPLGGILPPMGIGGVMLPGGGTTTYTWPVTPFYDIQVAVQMAVLKSMLQGEALWFELVLKPLTNGPFSTYYVIDSTTMSVPQTINLM